MAEVDSQKLTSAELSSLFTPEDYGVIANDQTYAHTNSLCIYNMLEAIRTAGGGVIWMNPNATYWVDFVNFIPGNVVIYANNATIKHVNPTSAYGRGGLVIGSSREWNYATAKALYVAGTYPGSISTSGVTDLPLGTYLRDNQSYVQAQNVTIHDLRMEAYFSSSTSWGGYAINCVNAQHVRIYNLKTYGWTQAFNFGNDSSTSSPSCHDVMAYGVTVEQADMVQTYYALGFIANSTNCGVDGGTLLTAMTAGSTNGSGVATNYVESAIIRNIKIPSLGLTTQSEGVLLNNSKGGIVENIDIRNCTNVISTYFTVSGYNDSTMPNVIRNITGQGVNIISIYAQYAHIESFEGVGNFTYDIYFANNNAANNTISQTPKVMGFGGTNLVSWFIQNNVISGWIRKYFYIRPAAILLNDKADTTSWNDNITVATKSGTNLYFEWQIPEGVKAVDDIRAYITFGPGSQDAGSNFEIALTQMVAYDGNANTAPNVLFSNSKTADGSTGTTLVAQITTDLGMVRLSDTSNTISGTTYTGLAYSHYIRIRATSNVANNVFKHMRVAGYN
ncbi:hypothetical protein [Pantoea cypripedii]|nr:hypothetical protein [Pantoea cypripedii]MBP2197602.1 hypothetical protein [Pantoea cypripedii]